MDSPFFTATDDDWATAYPPGHPVFQGHWYPDPLSWDHNPELAPFAPDDPFPPSLASVHPTLEGGWTTTNVNEGDEEGSVGDGSLEGQVEVSGTDEGYEGGGESTPSNVSRSKESSPSASDNSPPPPVDTSLSLLLAAPSFSSSSASPRLSASGPSSSTRPYSMQEVQNLRDGYLYMEDEHEKQGKEMARLRVEARRNEDRLQQKVDHYKALWDTEVEKSLDCKGKLEAKERELAEIERDFFIVRKEPGVTVTVVYEPFHSF